MQRESLRLYLDNLLETARFRDYCPNGLQVEGRAEVRRLVGGVTASLALIEAAIARDADGILVHHGWFWKSEEGRLTGFRKQRMAALLGQDLNLFAFHLPLDAHPELGNNAQLARLMNWSTHNRFGEQDLGFIGAPAREICTAELAAQLGATLGRETQLLGDPKRRVARVAWCSGGAQSYFEAAVLAGADVFVSGEVSEATTHLARETGVAYIAAGHHATERYGVRALGEHLEAQCGIRVEFVDIDNPV